MSHTAAGRTLGDQAGRQGDRESCARAGELHTGRSLRRGTHKFNELALRNTSVSISRALRGALT